jgi:chorismate synthase
VTALRFTTAGESHGAALISILEGVPAGLPLLARDIDEQLARRQQGYGRGRRMQIECDQVELLSGVRAGETIGSPIAMLIGNRDWRNWEEIMDPAPRPEDPDRKRVVTRVRPGHADLAGLLKYDRADARDVLERASARETAARVAAGAICRRLLGEFCVTVSSRVVHVGGLTSHEDIIARIDQAKRDGDTLGGVCEIVATGLPVGLSSHVSWDRKLDGRIARAIMSIPAVKGVEIGLGFEGARRPGSQVHDEIDPEPDRPLAGNVRRRSNNAGGLEGGITNGEPIVVRAAMKPISTLMRPLATVDVATGGAAEATVERSDVTAVEAMGVIAEAMLAFVLAQAFLEKFGGDSLGEMRRNYAGYVGGLRSALRG